MFKVYLLLGIVSAFVCGSAKAAESCIVCNSERDANCAVNPAVISPTNCASNREGVGCYTRIVDGRTLRGCTEELDQGVLDICRNDINSNCETCHNVNNLSGCNNEVFPRDRATCHQCSGNLLSNCSSNIQTNPTACPVFHNGEQCYVHKTENSIERGCLTSSGTKCNNASHCFTCSGHGCNNLNSNSTQIPVAPSSASSLEIFSSIILSVISFIVIRVLA